MLSWNILEIGTYYIYKRFLDTVTRKIASNRKKFLCEGGMVVYDAIPTKTAQNSRRSSRDTMMQQYISNQNMFMGQVLESKTMVTENYSRKNESGGEPSADGVLERGTVKAGILSTRKENIRELAEAIEMMKALDLEGNIAEILDEPRKDLKECIRFLKK